MAKIGAAKALIQKLLSLPITEAAINITTKRLSELLDEAVDIGIAPKDMNKLMKIFHKKVSYEKSPHSDLPSFQGTTMPSKKAAEEYFSTLPKSSPHYLASPSKLPNLSIGSLVKNAPVDISKMKSSEDYINKIWKFAQTQHNKAGEEFLPVVQRDLQRKAKQLWESKFPDKVKKLAQTKQAKKAAEIKADLLDPATPPGIPTRYLAKLSRKDYINSVIDNFLDNTMLKDISDKDFSEEAKRIQKWAGNQWDKANKNKPIPFKKIPDQPFKKGGSVKRPSMQKGGAYKGKKHSYAAGGKVNKLNF